MILKNYYKFFSIIVLIYILQLSSCSSSQELRLAQFKINGKLIYEKNCSNCHGKDGSGLRDLYPPLKNADLLQNKALAICIIKNGYKDPLVINGKTYTQAMPNLKLYDIDIAQVSTYIYSEFMKQDTLIDTKDVQKIKCKN